MTAHPDLPGDDGVLRALVRRRDTGNRSDGHRIALVVSGGGMRGAYAGGMAHALDDTGLGGCFDVVYGTSAGAYVGAALLQGHGRGTAHIFIEDVASRRFIDRRRLASGRPMVSLDHLIDYVLVASKPLSWERLRHSPVPLRGRDRRRRSHRARAGGAHRAGVEERTAGDGVDTAAGRAARRAARAPLDRRLGGRARPPVAVLDDAGHPARGQALLLSAALRRMAAP